jgi:hypothetical protein
MAPTPEAVTPSHPPAPVLRIVNPIVRTLLRTPILAGARGSLMALAFTGRKSQRRFTLPVSAHRIDGDLYALTGARWRLNFRGGAPAEVYYDGADLRMHGDLVEEPGAVAALYHRCAESYGPKNAQRLLGMRFTGTGIPSEDDFRTAAQTHHLAAVKLTPA